MIKMYLKRTITTISFMLLAAMAAFAQTSAPATLKDNDNKTAAEVWANAAIAARSVNEIVVIVFFRYIFIVFVLV